MRRGVVVASLLISQCSPALPIHRRFRDDAHTLHIVDVCYVCYHYLPVQKRHPWTGSQSCEREAIFTLSSEESKMHPFSQRPVKKCSRNAAYRVLLFLYRKVLTINTRCPAPVPHGCPRIHTTVWQLISSGVKGPTVIRACLMLYITHRRSRWPFNRPQGRLLYTRYK